MTVDILRSAPGGFAALTNPAAEPSNTSRPDLDGAAESRLAVFHAGGTRAGTPGAVFLWSICCAAVLSLHGTAGWFAAHWPAARPLDLSPPPAISIDLPAVPEPPPPQAASAKPAAPEAEAIDPPGPPVPDPAFPKTASLEPGPPEPGPLALPAPSSVAIPTPAATVPPPPPPPPPVAAPVAAPRPVPVKPPPRSQPAVQREPSREKLVDRPMGHTPPATVATQAPMTAPPVPAPRPPSTAVPSIAAPSAAPPSNAVPAWQGQVMARLQGAKRYPSEARLNQQQGVAYLRVALNRAGAVVSAQLERSSGIASLDAEALALVPRAAPLPAPPPELPGNPVIMVIPVRFALR